MENRVPGGDINPYLATAGLVAAGIDGMERGLTLEDAARGQRVRLGSAQGAAHDGRGAATCGSDSQFARETFGDEVVDHYANMARVELGVVRVDGHRLGAASQLRAVLTGRGHRT